MFMMQRAPLKLVKSRILFIIFNVWVGHLVSIYSYDILPFRWVMRIRNIIN